MPAHRRARLCLCGGRASAFCTSPSWASTSLYSRFPIFRKISSVCCHGCRLFLRPGIALRNVFALIDPALHANDAISGLRFGSAEIDVCTEGLQRQTALQVPLFARDFRAVQTAGNANLDSLAAKTQRRIHRLAHGTAEGNTLFQLQRD